METESFSFLSIFITFYFCPLIQLAVYTFVLLHALYNLQEQWSFVLLPLLPVSLFLSLQSPLHLEHWLVRISDSDEMIEWGNNWMTLWSTEVRFPLAKIPLKKKSTDQTLWIINNVLVTWLLVLSPTSAGSDVASSWLLTSHSIWICLSPSLIPHPTKPPLPALCESWNHKNNT